MVILGNDPALLTPGPLTTSAATKQAMLHDWGSWDTAFNQLTASICSDLVELVHGAPAYAFKPFYEKVRELDFIFYPGKLTRVKTFRVGCIGAIDANEMHNVANAIARAFETLGIRQVNLQGHAA